MSGYFHSGSSSQFFGNPMTAISIIGYVWSKDFSSFFSVFCGWTTSTRCFRMQRVKKILPCCTDSEIHGAFQRFISRARIDSLRFHNLAWWQHAFRVTVIMVSHEVNTGTFNPKYRAILFRIWLLAIFSYTRVSTPKGNISASIHEGGYGSVYVSLKCLINSSRVVCSSLSISCNVLWNLSACAYVSAEVIQNGLPVSLLVMFTIALRTAISILSIWSKINPPWTHVQF